MGQEGTSPVGTSPCHNRASLGESTCRCRESFLTLPGT